MPGIRKSRPPERMISHGGLSLSGSRGGANLRRSRADSTTMTPFAIDAATGHYEVNVKTGRPIHKPSNDASGHAEYSTGGLKLVAINHRKSS